MNSITCIGRGGVCKIAVSLILAAAVVRPAGGVVFPKVGGDISSADDWGSSMPGNLSTAYIDFTKSGTYYAGGDVGCRLLRLHADLNAPYAVVLDASAENPTVTFNQQAGDASILLMTRNGGSMTFKGGVWDAGGGAAATLRAGVVGNANGAGRRVTLSGGAEMKNLSNVFAAGNSGSTYDSDNLLLVTDGAVLSTTNFYGWSVYANNAVVTNNAVVVSDGGRLNVHTTFATDSKQASVTTDGDCRGNTVTVAAGGALIQRQDAAATAMIGNRSGGACLCVTGANARATLSQIRMGYETTSAGNTLRVADGGALDATDLYVGRFGSGNTLSVSNGTVSLNGLLTMGYANDATKNTSAGNTIHIAGPDARLTFAAPVLNNGEGFDFFPNAIDKAAPGNEVIVSDGATLTYPFAIRLFRRAHDNTFRVTRRATFGQAGTDAATLFGIGGLHPASSNNTVYVEDGGALAADYLYVTCVSNALVVSNGTVTCAAADASGNACVVGFRTTGGEPSTVRGNALVLRGRTPRVSAAGTLLMRYYARLEFDVPPEGYAAGHVPVTAKSLDLKTGGVLTANLDGYFEHGPTATYTLVETTDGVTLGDGVLAAANAAIDGLGAFRLSADGRNLLLHAKGTARLLILLK